MSEPHDPSDTNDTSQPEESDAPAKPAKPAKPVEPEWKRKARLARIFGDALPESTLDDRDEPRDQRDREEDAWLRSQVPPHHGKV
ncbi:hypothetical protein [Nocardioides sp.]|uniref:hypothetical protein n=1 Tax=Nocardioides sp. TaxID=35761 RepID=UPI0026160495|nr:hypothetical protein [Nocardioides sp.]